MMNFKFCNVLIVVVGIIGLLACQQSTDEASIIRIEIKTSEIGLDTLRIVDYSKLMPVNLAESRLDSSGIAVLEFSHDQPLFASLQIGGLGAELYLEPGYNLGVEFNTKNNPNIEYVGKGAHPNNYLFQQNQLIETIKVKGGQYISFLEPKSFILRLDSLKRVISELHLKYSNNSTEMPAHVLALFETRNQVKVDAICQEYSFLLSSNAFNMGDQNYQLPKEIEALTERVLYDTTMLNLGQLDYRHLLNMQTQSKIYLPILKKDLDRKDEKYYPVFSASQIRSVNYPDGIDEYIEATNVQYWISTRGLSKATDSIFNDFKINHVNSIYLPALKKNYDKFDAITHGHFAPDFDAITNMGDSVSLSELKGKVVYVDVWASWCKPCLEEIPSSNILQAKYEDRVLFMNVSVDKDTLAWRRMLDKQKSWKGLQVLNDGSIYNSYLISGIPHYILVDRQGRIVSANAPSPSSQEIQDLFEATLQ